MSRKFFIIFGEYWLRGEIFMRKGKKGLFFLLGGLGYVILELLWRGRSHWSMFLLGGGCFLILGKIGKKPVPAALQPLVGAVAITAGELATGLLLNRSFAVWDYRQEPFNFLGQICLPFSLLWVPVSFLGIRIYRFLERKLP